MDPTSIAAILAGIPWAAGQFFTKVPELAPDFWKKYWSPERIQASITPTREALASREGALLGRSAEEWGGRGLLSGAGARASKQAISDETSRLLTEALGRATQAELGTATQLGLAQFQADVSKALQTKGAWSQLATTMATPAVLKFAYGLGAKTPGEKIAAVPPTSIGLGEHGAKIPSLLSPEEQVLPLSPPPIPTEEPFIPTQSQASPEASLINQMEMMALINLLTKGGGGYSNWWQQPPWWQQLPMFGH